ncbi:MAG: hypothetical protein HY329_07035 [Chloroflexi bacterium]|nr:hypothetical protein [Chloroflexota bacterium]
MKVNRTKARLREGKPVLGTFAFLGDPSVVEIIGHAGFDFVIIDTEHTARDIGLVQDMVRAADAVNITPIVRVHEIEEKTILRALETGAQGIVVPFVRNGEEAKRANAAVRYPPTGARGTCTVTRAAEFGMLRPKFAEHAEACNRELLLIGLIEDAAGVENIADILDQGVEVAFLGRADLSSALGVSGQVEHPLVLGAVDRVLAATQGRQDRWGGIVPYGSGEGGRWLSQNCPFMCYSVDALVLLDAYRAALSELRQGLGSHAHS